MLESINPTAVIAASIAAYLIGWLWYSPILFLNPWMESIGKTKEDMASNKREMPRAMLYGFLVTVATAYGIAVFMSIVRPTSLMEALQLALLICFSFIVTTRFTDLIYESKDPHWSKKPQIHFFISVGYQLASFMTMTLIIWYMSRGIMM